MCANLAPRSPLPRPCIFSTISQGGKPAWAWQTPPVREWEHAPGSIRCEWVLRRGSSPCRSEEAFTRVEHRTNPSKDALRQSNFARLVLMLQQSSQKTDPAAFRLLKGCCSHVRPIIPVVWAWGRMDKCKWPYVLPTQHMRPFCSPFLFPGMEIRPHVRSSNQAWELIRHIMLISNNECSLLKSLCSLLGDVASVARIEHFSLSRILTLQEPQSLH